MRHGEIFYSHSSRSSGSGHHFLFLLLLLLPPPGRGLSSSFSPSPLFLLGIARRMHSGKQVTCSSDAVARQQIITKATTLTPLRLMGCSSSHLNRRERERERGLSSDSHVHQYPVLMICRAAYGSFSLSNTPSN